MSETFDQLYQKGRQIMVGDLEEAEILFQKAMSLSKASSNELQQAKCYVQFSRINSIQGNYSHAIIAAQKGLDIAESNQAYDTMFSAYYSLGNIYAQLGNLDRGLDYYQKGLKLCETYSFEHVENFLNNMAVIYSRSNMLVHSLNTLINAYDISVQSPKSITGYIAANIADVYLKQNEPEQAFAYCLKAEDLLSQFDKNLDYEIQLKKVYGILYRNKKDYIRSLNMFNEAISTAKHMKSDYRQAILLNELSKVYLDQNDFSQAIAILLKAYELTRKIQAKVEQRDISKMISDTYGQIGDFQLAYDFLKEYHLLDTQIRSKRLEDALMIQAAEFELSQAKKNAEMLRNSLADVQFITEIGRIITSSLDMNHVLHQINAQLKRITGLHAVGVFLYLESAEELEIKLFAEDGIDNREIYTKDSTAYKRAMTCIHEKATLYFEEPDGHSTRSMVCFPLMFMTKPIGVMTLKSASNDFLGDREVEMAMALGSYIAIALNNSQQSEVLRIKTQALENLSRTDDLTGLSNRRYTLELLRNEFERFIRSGRSFAVAIMDLDHFKRINDTYGHQAGDQAIQFASDIMNTCLRTYDVLARWGGEEFLLLLPETKVEDALQVCERIRAKISSSKMPFRNTYIDVTITIGLAESEPSLSIDDIISHADEALYRGKEDGRNCVKR